MTPTATPAIASAPTDLRTVHGSPCSPPGSAGTAAPASAGAPSSGSAGTASRAGACGPEVAGGGPAGASSSPCRG